MKFGLISLGGTSSNRILDAAREYFDTCIPLDIRKIEIKTSSKECNVYYDGKVLKNFDCIYIRGSFRYVLLKKAIAELLKEQCYIPMKPESFTICNNKFNTLIALQKQKLPVPTTYYAPNVETAKKILNLVNYPIIIKIPEGTQGKGVMFADSLPSAKSVLDAMGAFKQPFLIQEYIETGATDLRALVVGNKVVACMRRKASSNDLRANIHRGGDGETYILPPEIEDIAVKSAKAAGIDICGVDILEGNKIAVIEINTSPGLKGIMKYTGVKVDKMIAKYLYQQTKKFVKNKKNDDYQSILSSLEVVTPETNEIISNLNQVGNIVKMPSLITKMAGFLNEQEILYRVKKGKIEILPTHKEKNKEE